MSATPYEIVSRDTKSQNQSQLFWWTSTAPSLAHLLSQNAYTISSQLSLLRWYARFIVPALGPRPILGETPKFQPCPVADGSAVEHSINWKERDPHRTVRFTIEAVGEEAGSSLDPFNQMATKRLMNEMIADLPGLHLGRFETFAERFFLPHDVAEELLLKVPTGTPLSQVWVAFDLLHSGEIMTKVYFMPILKWIHTNITTKTLVFDVVRECNDRHGRFDAPIAILDSYMESFRAPIPAPVVEMVAIDCVDSPQSRIKIYLRTSVNTLSRAKKAFTLGGRLTGETIEAGLEALEELWPILFGLTSDQIEDIKVLPDGAYCGNAIEMKADNALPEVKLHIPIRKVAQTDLQVCTSLSAWIRKRGDVKFAAGYEANLKAAFPQNRLESTSGTHTFISFAYTQKTGVYMTMYYSTKILGVHMKRDIWEGYDNMWAERH